MTKRKSNERHPLSRRVVLAGASGLAGLASLPAIARAAPSGAPIKIGVIAEISNLLGSAIPKGAQMAVDAINAKGGVMGRPLQLVVFDDHLSSTDAVRAFQRLVTQDKVVAVIATFASEIALALMPWSARLKTPFITPGAASDAIPEQVHKDYDQFKYTFQSYFTSYFIAESTADSAHDVLVDQLHMKTCAIMSENADWTTPLDAAFATLLPSAGLKIVDHVRFSPDTTDFTPIFNKIEAKKPDVIITGMAHTGVVPAVQWTQGRIPIPLYGVSVQATNAAFWKATHGSAEGITSQTCAGPDSEITPVTLPFTKAYQKRFSLLPAFDAYTSYDMVHAIAAAIARAKSTSSDEMVTALEATDLIGTIGRIKFYGREARFTHAVEFGLDLVPGVMIQWQQGEQKTIWPLKFATAKISYPSFVKLPA